VSNQSLEYRNLTLTFNPDTASSDRNYIAGFSIRDQNTYIAGITELIDLDAVLVVASMNIGVSPCFLQLTTVIDTSMSSPTVVNATL
jgi:hypothetical protein